MSRVEAKRQRGVQPAAGNAPDCQNLGGSDSLRIALETVPSGSSEVGILEAQRKDYRW